MVNKTILIIILTSLLFGIGIGIGIFFVNRPCNDLSLNTTLRMVNYTSSTDALLMETTGLTSVTEGLTSGTKGSPLKLEALTLEDVDDTLRMSTAMSFSQDHFVTTIKPRPENEPQIRGSFNPDDMTMKKIRLNCEPAHDNFFFQDEGDFQNTLQEMRETCIKAVLRKLETAAAERNKREVKEVNGSNVEVNKNLSEIKTEHNNDENEYDADSVGSENVNPISLPKINY